MTGDDAVTKSNSDAQREAHLIDVAARAYQQARREMFDRGDSASLAITPRQREVLAQLVAAEEDLRQFRIERSARFSRPSACEDARVTAQD